MIRLTIHGQPVSKSNRSQIIKLGERYSLGKSTEAKAYIRDTLRQIPPAARQQLEGPLRITLRMFYASERPDLDESQLLDCLQDQWKRDPTAGRVLLQAGVYRNDRQIREKHVYHGIDARRPRAEIEIEALQPQQPGLVLDDPAAECAF